MFFNNATSPHLTPPANVSGIMLRVIIALIPGIITCIHFFGWGVLVNIMVAIITALISEAAMLMVRKRPAIMFLKDYSAVLTAILLALALPPLAPWWLTVTSTAFAIVFAKQLYGGLGYNPFNPAMVGYVVALISFPKEMTQWLLPNVDVGLLDAIQIQLGSSVPASIQVDAITSATPLDTIKTQLSLSKTLSEIQTSGLFGAFGGTGWEWIGVAFLAGGIYLMINSLIRWHIPLAMLGSIFIMAMIFNFFDSDNYATPTFHLFSGGTMLAAFFIATDPVTASTTVKGRLIFGAGIGILTYTIRTWGGYPDGIAFSVLLMNTAVPTIDYYTQPRVFGGKKK
jgi:electron transport complex protein RnfD